MAKNKVQEEDKKEPTFEQMEALNTPPENVENSEIEKTENSISEPNDSVINSKINEEKKMAKDKFTVTADEIAEFQKHQAEKAIKKAKKKAEAKAQKKADKHTSKLINQNWKKHSKEIDEKLDLRWKDHSKEIDEKLDTREKSQMAKFNEIVEIKESEASATDLIVGGAILVGAVYIGKKIYDRLTDKNSINTINVGVPTDGITDII